MISMWIDCCQVTLIINHFTFFMSSIYLRFFGLLNMVNFHGHLMNKPLLNLFYVPGTMLFDGDTVLT